MRRKIYTYGALIVLMVLFAISASYMLPNPAEVDRMIKESNEPQSGAPPKYRPGRGGPVRTVSSKDRKKPSTRPFLKQDPHQKYNPPIPTKEPGD